MHFGSLPKSYYDDESMRGDEWEMFALAHKDVSLMKMCKRVS
jgi:hypothetical protein